MLLIYTCSYNRTEDFNILGASNMNSISVGTSPGCDYSEIRGFYILTVLKAKMHLLCILYPQIFYLYILALIECYCLKTEQKYFLKRNL